MQTRPYSRFDRYIETRRSKYTRDGYRRGATDFIGDPDAFLELAADRKKAEQYLIDRVIERRGKWAGSSILTALAMVKSFLDFEEVPLNWKKIKQVAPRGSFVALDRAPLKEEIRELLKGAALRERVTILVMASSGIRVGAFAYLKVGHLKILESGIGKLLVYAGEREDEYTTFVSPEAVKAIKEYFDARKTFAKEDPD